MSQELMTKIKQIAENEKRSRSNVVRVLLNEALEKRQIMEPYHEEHQEV